MNIENQDSRVPVDGARELVGYIVEIKSGDAWRRRKYYGSILWTGDPEQARLEAEGWAEEGYPVRVREVFVVASPTNAPVSVEPARALVIEYMERVIADTYARGRDGRELATFIDEDADNLIALLRSVSVELDSREADLLKLAETWRDRAGRFAEKSERSEVEERHRYAQMANEVGKCAIELSAALRTMPDRKEEV